MRELSIVSFLILSISGIAMAQFPRTTLEKVRQIRLLESTREDVKRILYDFKASDDDDHFQEFSNDDVDIEISYSSGTCAEGPDDDDASGMWNVRKWTVTRIEISPEDAVKPESIGLDFSKFKQEPRWPHDSDSWVFHDKAAGIAVKTNEDGIEKLIFFPPRDNRRQLCRNSTAAKGFYTRKGWFSQTKPYDFICVLTNIPANVQEMNLNASEIDATSTTPISVVTVATDAENDVLTYSYKVSAGKIVGQGSSVEWDFTGVSAGTYSITVGVDDGVGVVGKTVTKTVVVK